MFILPYVAGTGTHMNTQVPPPDEPDIYESLINALIAASTGFREASVHFEAGLPHMRRAFELHEEVRLIIDAAYPVSAETTTLLLEAVALIQADPQGNATQALALSAQVTADLNRTRTVAPHVPALLQQASTETLDGIAIWNQGSESLRIGLERATTLLQAARRRQTNGDMPDALTA
jgi:hypothetical protein